MKKLLILAYAYFPVENANTRIIKNLCERLAGRYDVTVVTVKTPLPDPAEDGAVRVIRVPGYSFHREQNTGKLTPGILFRMAAARIEEKLRRDETILMLHRLYEHEIRKAVKIPDYDALISFSAPFLTHCCASRLVKESRIPWIAVCFDPFFSGRIFDPGRLESRKKQEEAVMAPATKVLITHPTDRDYLEYGVDFQEKILGMELPGIVRRAADGESPEHEKCRCSFFGSIYRQIRNPKAAVDLFTAAADETEMLFVGPLDDADATVEEFFPAGCPCKYIGEKRGEALAREYAEADVLVNIGNSIGNQMPSKIFEYISTGKPIINIYKSPECPTLQYLGKYPAALNLYEADITADPEGSAAKVRAFCREQKGKRVPADEILRLYGENTYDWFAETLCRETDLAMSGGKTEE